MSALTLGLLVLGLVCWAVGAYNRLTRLRVQVAQSFKSWEARNQAVLDPIQQALVQWPAAQSTPLGRRLCAALTQFDVACQSARAQPLQAERMAALQASAEVLVATWMEWIATWQQDHAESVGLLSSLWFERAHQAHPAHEHFVHAVEAYNRAIAQFPATLIARAFHFLPASPALPAWLTSPGINP